MPAGCKLETETKRLRVLHVGRVKVIQQRLLEGPPKIATLRRGSTGRWYVTFTRACAGPLPLPETSNKGASMRG